MKNSQDEMRMKQKDGKEKISVEVQITSQEKEKNREEDNRAEHQIREEEIENTVQKDQRATNESEKGSPERNQSNRKHETCLIRQEMKETPENNLIKGKYFAVYGLYNVHFDNLHLFLICYVVSKLFFSSQCLI